MQKNKNELTTNDVLKRIEHAKGAIIDVRPIEAYNGWKLKGEPRGGHIKGAKTFPLKWLNYKDWQQILSDKGVVQTAPVVVYAYNNADAEMFADSLEAKGYADVAVYNNFISEWSAREELPMDHLPRFSQLVYPQWLAALAAGKSPEEFNGNDYAICHAHYGFRKDYEDGHIPGAIALDTMELESPETWNRRSPTELRETLERHSIHKDTTVVVYGRFSHPDNKDRYPGQNAGHLGAMRCALIMMYAGVKDVRILNGGLNAWQEEGFSLSTQDTIPVPITDFGAEIPGNPTYFVDMPEAKQLLDASDGELVSVRSWAEFVGDFSGYNYIGKTGRIPGAVFGNCGSDAYHMENYRNPDHTMREFHEVRANWEENGIVPDKRIAFYCGTGWRGSEAFMSAYMMAWPNIAVFDGGWFEWSNDPNNPIEKGEPQ